MRTLGQKTSFFNFSRALPHLAKEGRELRQYPERESVLAGLGTRNPSYQKWEWFDLTRWRRISENARGGWVNGILVILSAQTFGHLQKCACEQPGIYPSMQQISCLFVCLQSCAYMVSQMFNGWWRGDWRNSEVNDKWNRTQAHGEIFPFTILCVFSEYSALYFRFQRKQFCICVLTSFHF